MLALCIEDIDLYVTEDNTKLSLSLPLGSCTHELLFFSCLRQAGSKLLTPQIRMRLMKYTAKCIMSLC